MLKPVERLTVAATVLAFGPRLLHRGMFFDGVTYATLSRNLAVGRGRFWEPFYTATLLPQYHDNPPLAIGLQSLWFRAFGDHWYVERAYDAACSVAVVLLIVAIWKQLAPPTERAGIAWLPILLWLAPPIVSWTMVGNMLETTLIVFTTAAVAAVVAATGSAGRGRAAAWGGVSGGCVVAAALTKGPVAFFPLAAPVLLFLLGDRRERGRLERCGFVLAGQLLAVSIAAIAIFSWPEARESLSAYVSRQLVPALSGATNPRPVPRLQVVSVLGQQVVVALVVACALMIALARKWFAPTTADRRWGIAFVALGLAATLPIMVSTKQTGYYFAPAIPFYAIGAALFMRQTAIAVAEKARVAVNALTALVAAAAIAGCVTGTGRDRVLLAELDRLDSVVPRGQTIRLCSASATDWTLHAWFARRFEVSLEPVDGAPPGLFLQTGGKPGCAPSTCKAVSNPEAWLVLRRCG